MPTLAVEIAFSAGANPSAWSLGNSPFPTTLAEPLLDIWTDVTADVRGINIERGKSRELDMFRAARCSVVLDNRSRDYDPINLSGPYVDGGVTQVKPGRRMRVRATHPTTLVEYDQFMGVIRDWSLDYTGPFDARATPQATDFLGDLALGDVAITTTAGLSGAVIEELLQEGGLSAYQLDDGDVSMQAMTYDTDLLAAVQNIVRSEQGYFYVENDGTITFIERTGPVALTRSNTSNGTFGAGNLNYQDIKIAYESDILKNDAHFTRTGGTEQTYTDTDSVLAYGKHSETFTGLANESDADALYLATGYVGKWGEPQYRIRSITVAGRYHADTMTQVLARRLLDRITVNFTPVGGGSPISQDAMVIGIKHTISAMVMVTTFTLAHVLPYGWMLGVGELGDTTGLTTTALAF